MATDAGAGQSAVLWRRWLLALCALGIVLLAFDVLISVPLTGDPGLGAGPTGSPYVARLVVSPRSDAASSGLRTNDLLDVRELSPPDRYRVFAPFYAIGDHIAMSVRRAGTTVRVALAVRTRHKAHWSAWVAYAGFLWVLVFAAVLAWRRPDNREARVLSLLLSLSIVGGVLDSFNLLTPWPALDAVADSISQPVSLAGTVLLATYAMLFARPPSLIRRVLAGLSYIACAVAALYGIAYVIAIWTAASDPGGPFFTSNAAQIVQYPLPYIVTLLCALVSVAAARGAERARLSWAMLSLGFWYVVIIVNNLLPIFIPASAPVVFVLVNVSDFIAPLGLTYSVLNRRLLDLGFALNRAAVFTAVSVIVVGVFILVEWLLGNWLAGQSHATNVIVTAALILTLGLSVNAIHRRVDHFVDTIFFRKRHEDEKALHTFAHEAAYITDAPTLLQRTKYVLDHHADAAFVSIALDDGDGLFANVSENDPAVVAMRARHKPIDLHTVQTALSGDFAYPMVTRGRLIGALVLGPKRSGESYAPDESDAIEYLAHSVGMALDVLATKTDGSRDALLQAIAGLSELTRAIYEQNRELKAIIAASLQTPDLEAESK